MSGKYMAVYANVVKIAKLKKFINCLIIVFEISKPVTTS